MKHYLRFMISLILATVWSLGGYAQEKTLSVDFESDLTTSSYPDWKFSNITKAKTISAHSGNFYGNTTGLKTAYVQTRNVIEAPGILTFFISKETNNITSSNWKIQVSTDETKWTDVNSISAVSGVTKGTWNKVTQDLTNYKNVYVRVKYDGTVAIRCIDDVTLTYTSTSRTATTLTFPQSSISYATTDDLSSFTGQTPTLTAGDETLTGKSFTYSTYSKAGDDIFSSFDESTGVLALNGNAGTAKVTATFKGDDTYASSTALYTISVKYVVKDIATLKPLITSTSSSSTQSFSLKLTDAIVTYKNGSNAYVQDKTGGLYTTGGSTLNVGDKINGIVDVKAYKKTGQRIVTSWTLSSDANVEHDVEFTPEVVTVAQLNEDIDKYENMQVKVVGATVNAAMSNNQTTVSQNGEKITLFSKAYNINWELKADDYVDIVGFPCKYNSTNEICVWRKGDVTINESVVATTLSLTPATKEYTVEKGKESAFTAPTVTVTDANNETVADAKITYKSSNTDVATVAEDGKVTFVGFGKTTITASYAGDATHKAAADISYTIIYGKVKTTMAWSEETVTANIGQNFTAPTISLTANGDILDGKTITYTSSEPTVAEISETGVVTIKGEGTTTITANFAGDDTYAEAEAKYTLTVVDPNKMEVTFDFTDPSKYEYDKPDTGKGTDLTVGATITSGVVTLKNEKNPQSSTRFWNSNGTITLRAYDGAQLSLSVPTGYYITKVVYNDDKNCKNFTCDSGDLNTETQTWTGNANSIMMAFSGGQGQFSSMTVCYAKSSETEATTGTLTFKAQNSDGYYATFSSDKDVVFTNDVVVSGVSVASGKLSLNDLTADIYEVTDVTAGEDKDGAVEGYYVPANTGVLVYCTDATATYYFPKDAQTFTLLANQLKAAPAEGEVFTAEGGYKYYKLAYDDFDAKTGLGFYWGADNGGAFSVKAGTAYLAVPAAEANSAKSFSFDGGTTGINDVMANDNKVKNIYNLNGQRVAHMSKAGLYIVNGKKVVIRK